MQYSLFVIVAGLVVFQSFESQGLLGRATYFTVKYLSCDGKKVGDRFNHPTDCTRYIQCAQWGPIDKPCGSCPIDEVTCPEGFLFFDPVTTVCNWANETDCITTNENLIRTAENIIETSTGQPLQHSKVRLNEIFNVKTLEASAGRPYEVSIQEITSNGRPYGISGQQPFERSNPRSYEISKGEPFEWSQGEPQVTQNRRQLERSNEISLGTSNERPLKLSTGGSTVVGRWMESIPQSPIRRAKGFSRVQGIKREAGAPESSLAAVSRLSDRPEGESCDPFKCLTEGYCLNFTRCKRTESADGPLNPNGVIVHDACGQDHLGTQLYFNSGKNKEHGGVCDYWRNLLKETQEIYLNDTNCIPPRCNFSQKDPCTANYAYFNGSATESISCPSTLVWDQGKRTCMDPCFANYTDIKNTTRACKDLLAITGCHVTRPPINKN